MVICHVLVLPSLVVILVGDTALGPDGRVLGDFGGDPRNLRAEVHVHNVSFMDR
jgi:hypothetical protein